MTKRPILPSLAPLCLYRPVWTMFTPFELGQTFLGCGREIWNVGVGVEMKSGCGWGHERPHWGRPCPRQCPGRASPSFLRVSASLSWAWICALSSCIFLQLSAYWRLHGRGEGEEWKVLDEQRNTWEGGGIKRRVGKVEELTWQALWWWWWGPCPPGCRWCRPACSPSSLGHQVSGAK